MRPAPALQVIGLNGDGRASPLPALPLPCPAGNCVVLKPSEFSRSTEKVLAEVLPQYLDQVSRAWGGPSSYTQAEQGQTGPPGKTRVPTSILPPLGCGAMARPLSPQPLSL